MQKLRRQYMIAIIQPKLRQTTHPKHGGREICLVFGEHSTAQPSMNTITLLTYQLKRRHNEL